MRCSSKNERESKNKHMKIMVLDFKINKASVIYQIKQKKKMIQEYLIWVYAMEQKAKREATVLGRKGESWSKIKQDNSCIMKLLEQKIKHYRVESLLLKIKAKIPKV